MTLTVRTSRKIQAPIDLVWRIISDTNNEPSYWPGMKSVTNMRKDKSIIEREVEVILGYRCVETVRLHPEKHLLQCKIYKGPMVGEKSIAATKLPGEDTDTKVEVVWTIGFRGIFRIFWPLARIYVVASSWRALANLEKRLILCRV